MTLPQIQTVYVVYNGTGGVINSVWALELLADQRAAQLNAAGGEMLEYAVVKELVQNRVG